MNVASVQAKGDKAGIMIMDDGSRIWTPEKAKADELVGKPIPADWTQKQGEYGPQAFPPRERKGGGAAPAWRNTEAGFRAEQDFMNRRTALMQAVADLPDASPANVLIHANIFYEWLSGSPVHSGQPAAQPTSSTAEVGLKAAAGNDDAGAKDIGEGVGGPCAHLNAVRSYPNGRPTPANKAYCPDCSRLVAA